MTRAESGLLGPIQGWMIERLGTKRVIRIGAVLFAVGWILFSRLDSLLEFFGFYLLCNKVGSILALLAFGVVSSSSGSQRWAVLSVLPFFLIGLLVLRSMADHPPEPAEQP